MGTLTEEIFSRRLGRDVHAGEIVVAPVDYAMAHDVTGPLAIEAFRKLEVPLWDPERVIMVFDHILPANTVASAGLHKIVRDFADEVGGTHVFQEGVCHQLMVEEGVIRPGGIVVGADSHSTPYCALRCFSARRRCSTFTRSRPCIAALSRSMPRNSNLKSPARRRSTTSRTSAPSKAPSWTRSSWAAAPTAGSRTWRSSPDISRASRCTRVPGRSSFPRRSRSTWRPCRAATSRLSWKPVRW